MKKGSWKKVGAWSFDSRDCRRTHTRASQPTPHSDIVALASTTFLLGYSLILVLVDNGLTVNHRDSQLAWVCDQRLCNRLATCKAYSPLATTLFAVCHEDSPYSFACTQRLSRSHELVSNRLSVWQHTLPIASSTASPTTCDTVRSERACRSGGGAGGGRAALDALVASLLAWRRIDGRHEADPHRIRCRGNRCRVAWPVRVFTATLSLFSTMRPLQDVATQRLLLLSNHGKQ